jgi:hypothetical protein
MKRFLLILNILALVFGALAMQSCEDTSNEYHHHHHGYNDRHDNDGNGYDNEHSYNENRYNRESYPDRPSIDVHY